MTVIKQYNTGTSVWEPIVSGVQGPVGATGATGRGYSGVSSTNGGLLMDVMMPPTLNVVYSGAYSVGDLIKISGNASNYVLGTITSVVTDTSIGVSYNYTSIVGGGSFGSFTVSLIGETGPTGPVGPAGSWASAQTVKSVTAPYYPILNSDAGKIILYQGTFVDPLFMVNLYTELTPGQKIDFINLGPGQINFGSETVTLLGTPGLRTRTTYSAASLVCVGINIYILVGDLSA